MYKIVGFPRTRAMRVMWLLEELGEPYDQEPALPQSEAVRALTPDGKVPILIDGDTAITESAAICTYLADKHGKFTFPAGSLERARQDSFTQLCVDVLEGPLWTTSKNSYVYPEDLRVPQIFDQCRMEFGRGLETLAQRMGEGPYVMGETFTIADIIIGHCSGWAVTLRFPMPKEGPVYDYFKRLRQRPGFLAMKAKVDAAQ